MFAESVPTYHSASYVVGWPWTFGPRAVPVICFKLFVCYSCLLSTSRLRLICAPDSICPSSVHLKSFWGPLAFLSSNSSVELHLDEEDLNPDLQNLSLLIRAWFTEVNLEVTLIKVRISVYGRTLSTIKFIPLPSDKAWFPKNAYLLNGSI